MNISPSVVSEILARYWPKATYTAEQIAAISHEFRGLDDEQADAVAAKVYRDQKSGRREPNVRMIADQAASARRDEYQRRASLAGGEAVAGETDWQRGMRLRMNARGWADDVRGFVVWVYSAKYAQACELYLLPRWGYTRETHALWWWKMNGTEVMHDLEQAFGSDNERAADDALYRIMGEEYPVIAEYQDGRAARLRRHERETKAETAARKTEYEQRGLNRRPKYTPNHERPEQCTP